MFRESLFYELKKLEIQRLVRFLVSVFLCVLFCLVFPGFVSGGGGLSVLSGGLGCLAG